MSFGLFKSSTALWLPLDPSCKCNSLRRVDFRSRLTCDAHNRGFVKNGSYIQILDTTLLMLYQSFQNTRKQFCIAN